jgi:dolichyl-phosphate beta-glucosyltransferase
MHAQTPVRGRDGPLTSLIFPTFNPGARLDETWQQVVKFLDGAPEPWEVLFVCDGCNDGTPARLSALCGTVAHRIGVLSYATNHGKGYAVRRGLEAARGNWRIFADVDLAYSLDEVRRVAEVLRSGADVAIASRTHPDSRLVLPPRLQGYAYRRHLQSLVFSALVRWLLPVRQHDSQAGLKGMTARVADLLLPHLRCDGFGFDCELLTACSRFGLMVREVPVSVRYEDRVSTTGASTMPRMVRELLGIRRAWRGVPVRQAAQEHKEAA